jgi:hypothetical protein
VKLLSHLFAAAGAVLVMLAVGSPAHAGSNEEAAAEALFMEGKRLMAEGKYSLACPKLAESERLDPAVGTLLNLGECYEKNGQTASAWAAFRAAASLGRKDHQEEKERVARERAAAIEGRLSRLTITVSPEARAANVQVKRDGVALLDASWGSPIPIDPGKHVVEAAAPGKKPWSQTVDLPAGGGSVVVNVPALVTDTAPPAGPTPPGVAPALASATEQASAPPRSGGWQRPAAFVVGGVGVAGLVVGTVFGLQAKSKQSDSEAFCRPDDTNVCGQQGVDLRNEARTSATIATVGFIAGGVGLVGSVVLYLTSDSGSKTASAGEAKRALAVVPSAGADSAGVLVRGTF